MKRPSGWDDFTGKFNQTHTKINELIKTLTILSKLFQEIERVN